MKDTKDTIPKTISKKKVLIVEGEDEVNFFTALLEHMRITGFEIHGIGGKDKFKSIFPALVRMPGFSDVEVLAVVRDADKDADAAFKSVRNILEREGLKPPIKMNQFSNKSKPIVGIFIMPGNSDTGMLEDLCLKTVENHPAMKCVNSFIDCVSKLDNPPNNISKAKAQVFLAAMPKLVNSVGLGAKKRYWNFNSKELTNLKSFITWAQSIV